MDPSEAVVMRKEFVALAKSHSGLEEKLALAHGEIEQLRGEVASRDVELGLAHGEIEQLRGEVGAGKKTIAALMKKLDDAGIKIDDLERREAYHDSPNVPPSHRSLALLAMRKADTEARRRASTGRGPGREKGHPGTTAKLDTGGVVEHRRASAPNGCPKCGRTDMRWKRGIPRDLVDLAIKKLEKRLFLHDLECMGCGHVVKASRSDIVPKTILGPAAVAFVGSLKHHFHATAGQTRGMLRDTASMRLSRATAAAAINAAADGLSGRADAIREIEEILCLAGEVDETLDLTAVSREPEDDGSPPGTGKNRRRLEYKDGWIWIAVTDYSVRIWVSTSRGRAVFEEYFPDRKDAETAHDAYVVYLACKISQDDWVHKIRRARHLAMREKDPALKAALEALADRMAGAYVRAKDLVAPGGAFPDAAAGEKADSVEAEMKAIADEYERLGKDKMATYVRGGLGKYATFIRRPGMRPNTARAEQVAKWLKGWLKNSEKTVTVEGRRRKSDMCTVGLTARQRGLRLYDLLLIVPPDTCPPARHPPRRRLQ